jgi:glycerate dehydrogenase
MTAVFLDYATVSYGDLDPAALRRALPGLILHDLTEEADLAARLAPAETVLLNKSRLNRERIALAPRLRLVLVAGTGTDNVDAQAARERGIAVFNVPGYCTRSVAQHAWALILGLRQHLLEFRGYCLDGGWGQDRVTELRAYPIRELAGHTLGVVGWGELGRGVAAVAEAFGMRVVIANRIGGTAQPGRLDLPELLRSADVVSLHCPLTPATRGLIGAAELALMKPDAILINTARGGLIDGAALKAALIERRIAGAGIDVLPQEPPVDGDPLLDPGIPNLLLTPHVAWGAREARQRCIDAMAANALDFAAGGNRNRVV